jgi:hypothetical protein
VAPQEGPLMRYVLSFGSGNAGSTPAFLHYKNADTLADVAPPPIGELGNGQFYFDEPWSDPAVTSIVYVATHDGTATGAEVEGAIQSTGASAALALVSGALRYVLSFGALNAGSTPRFIHYRNADTLSDVAQPPIGEIGNGQFYFDELWASPSVTSVAYVATHDGTATGVELEGVIQSTDASAALALAAAQRLRSVTVSDIIRRSLRSIGAIAGGETPSATEEADALQVLNAMLDSWNTESLAVYALRDETLTLTGAASYTIGMGGALNTARPVKIESAYVRLSDNDYHAKLASAEAWYRLAAKTTTGSVAEWLYYEPSYPLGTLYLYPQPTAGVLHLVTRVPLAAYAASDSLALPPGYQDAITYHLALRLAIEFSRPVTPELAALARAAKDNIQRGNFRVPVMSTGLEGRRKANILSGE